MNQRHRHPDEDRIQAYFDGRLPDGERAAIRAHLGRCAACAAEAEAWRELFAGLEELPRHAPSPGFAERVLDQVTVTEGVGARIRRWLSSLVPSPRPATDHLDPRLALEYVDGVVSSGRRSRIEGHLEGCSACRDEVAAWRSVVDRLESLERPAPSPDFADAVMARVRVPEREAEPARAPTGTASWIDRLGPRSRAGRAAAATAVLAPAAAMIGAAVALFSHPLLTPAHLAAFLWWRVSGTVGELLASATAAVTESGLVFRAGELGGELLSSPLVAGSALLAFSAATLGAGWILYRNLRATSARSRSYANGTA